MIAIIASFSSFIVITAFASDNTFAIINSYNLYFIITQEVNFFAQG